MRLYASSPVSGLIHAGEYERSERGFLNAFPGPGHVFVDAGAHVGLLTPVAACPVGDSGTVHALEPGRETCRRLLSTVELNGPDDAVCHRASRSDGAARLDPNVSPGYRMFVYHARARGLVPDPLRERYEAVNPVAARRPERVAKRPGLSRRSCRQQVIAVPCPGSWDSPRRRRSAFREKMGCGCKGGVVPDVDARIQGVRETYALVQTLRLPERWTDRAGLACMLGYLEGCRYPRPSTHGRGPDAGEPGGRHRGPRVRACH
jgi:FkbM family methyltransferase